MLNDWALTMDFISSYHYKYLSTEGGASVPIWKNVENGISCLKGILREDLAGQIVQNQIRSQTNAKKQLTKGV